MSQVSISRVHHAVFPFYRRVNRLSRPLREERWIGAERENNVDILDSLIISDNSTFISLYDTWSLIGIIYVLCIYLSAYNLNYRKFSDLIVSDLGFNYFFFDFFLNWPNIIQKLYYFCTFV